MSTDLVLLTRAADYAARQHIAQRRKGERAEPYINHLTEVAALLAEATGGDDVVLLMGGLLHDTLEDTDATYEDLVERFGPEVAALVAEVTDDKSLPKEERKRLQIEKTAGKSRRAKLLKLADKTSNLRSLLASPPAGWSRQRLAEYVVWARDVVRSCRGLNPRLEAAFDAAHEQASRNFG
jgi:(p)ppGpp synthase/HD superfamily hydrolase